LMAAQLKTAVLGATGYAGFELARLLMRHPRLAKPMLLGREQEGSGAASLAEIFPQVSGNGSCQVEPFGWAKLKSAGIDLLFLATPHELSRELVPQALEQGVRVIDLSGAWRLRDAVNRQVYGFKNDQDSMTEQISRNAAYGLPELHSAHIKAANVVANPGCYATSIILPLAPLIHAGLLDLEHGVICDSKSGVSGAGKQPTQRTHFVEVAENFSAYAVFGHRHTGEILEQLGLVSDQVVFTPHLLPIPRGILSTIYVRLKQAGTINAVEACLRNFYQGKPWVRVFAAPRLPEIQFSLRTNFCDIGAALAPDGKRLLVISCLDNLVKGAAGQAVQNMNVMFGWDEREGLN
jgi:N-acetyl-gamma-glutamyl-phosphate reductase